MSPKTVQVLMGHSSNAMTTKYTNITDIYMNEEKKTNAVFQNFSMQNFLYTKTKV